jgi:hypothetical protein
MEYNYNNIKEKAYKVALSFKGTQLAEEKIYAKLEKQGFPENIAKEVALNLSLSNSRNSKGDINYKKLAIIIPSVWLILAVCVFLFTDSALNSFWVFLSGVGVTCLIHILTTDE